MNNKFIFFNNIIQKTDLFLFLDPRVEGVIVPEYLRNHHTLTLQFGFDLSIPIKDLEYDDEGVAATLSFARVPCFCFIPWDAVYGISDSGFNHTRIFSEYVPQEYFKNTTLNLHSIDGGKSKTSKPFNVKSADRSHLKLIK